MVKVLRPGIRSLTHMAMIVLNNTNTVDTYVPSGFHTEGGGALEFVPPSHNFPYQEILKLSMVIILAIYMLLNVSMCHQNVRKFCPKLCQKQSERYINFLGGGGGGGGGYVPRPL